MQIHSVSLTLLKPVRQDSTMSGEHVLYLFASHLTTEHLNHNWSHTLGHLQCFCETSLSQKLHHICFLVVAIHDCYMLVVIHLPEPLSYRLFVYLPYVLRVICFSFSEGAPLNFSDMFWVQFSSFSSLVFLVPRCFAINVAALHSFLILIFSKVIVSSSVFYVFSHVLSFVSFTFFTVINWFVFICIFCLFAVVSHLHCSVFHCGNIMKFI